MQIELIVTRHQGLVEFLREKGYVAPDVTVLSHATAEDVAGNTVWGVLPHNLSVLTNKFIEIPLDLPLEMRGKELTLEDMYKYAGEPVAYSVTATSIPLPKRELLWEDGLETGGIGRRKLFLIKEEQAYEFQGESIPGVCVALSEKYNKNGKWSYTAYRLALASGVDVVQFSGWGWLRQMGSISEVSAKLRISQGGAKRILSKKVQDSSKWDGCATFLDYIEGKEKLVNELEQ